jgi:hypothetical protein
MVRGVAVVYLLLQTYNRYAVLTADYSYHVFAPKVHRATPDAVILRPFGACAASLLSASVGVIKVVRCFVKPVCGLRGGNAGFRCGVALLVLVPYQHGKCGKGT